MMLMIMLAQHTGLAPLDSLGTCSLLECQMITPANG